MIKIIGNLLFVLSTLSVAPLNAESIKSDFTFNQERMVVDHGEIFLVSTFDSQDGITVYNFNGQRLWETKFHAKILSWNVQPDIIIVFSKDRDSHSTYLTCLSRTTGRMLWEKP